MLLRGIHLGSRKKPNVGVAHSRLSKTVLCRGLEKNGMFRAWHGRGMGMAWHGMAWQV
jgi:hypothetical protein